MYTEVYTCIMPKANYPDVGSSSVGPIPKYLTLCTYLPAVLSEGGGGKAREWGQGRGTRLQVFGQQPIVYEGRRGKSIDRIFITSFI
jgi:hypothetical protein